MKLEGRILLFDTVNKNRDIFPKDCEITIPEKLPLTWQFHHQEVIGMAEVIKDDLGLIAKVEITPNAHIKEEDLKSIFENGKFGVGVYYNKVIEELKLDKDLWTRTVELLIKENKPDYILQTCKRCNGSGSIFDLDPYSVNYSTCPECNGEGKIKIGYH